MPIRLRQLAMIAVFDLGGPLLVYSLLRSAGMSAVSALVLSAVPPALGIAVGALVDRRLDIIGAVVLAGIAVGSVLGLTSHNAKLFLAEGSVPTLVFALACLGSVWLERPLIFRMALELIGPDTPRGRDIAGAWRYPRFRRAFRVITVAWGISYLVEAALRVVVVETTSTGIALFFSKVVPYVFAVALSVGTLVYGEHEKNKAERLAAIAAAGTEASPAPRAVPLTPAARAPATGPYTLVRCLARSSSPTTSRHVRAVSSRSCTRWPPGCPQAR
jgi:intracellular septation protein A